MLLGLLRSSLFWIISAFIIWVLAFLGFLSSKLVLINDALSYYEHTRFFIENLVKGIFPLWHPFWYYGAPNDFFLRRIGVLNPFYLIIALLESVGVPYTLAYLWFLAMYYWSGMIAFYLLAMRIYRDRLIAYGGYLMLLFSALGTRIFDSYMMLVTVPLIWFFYFLVAFSQTPRKHFFFGMCLSFMILASTYIPFYFLIFLCIFLFFFVLFYFKQIPEIIRQYMGFLKSNKILVIISLGIVLCSFVPLVTFFHDSTRGQIVLPVRHGGATSGQALVVPHQTLDWGAVEDLVFSLFFSDLRTYRFAIVYVPFFAFIVFALGLFCRISRRAAFMFMCGFFLFCSIIPHGLPFYDFFYRHIFFLKYFRNLHFFLWFILIPLFVFLVLEHWKIFTDIKPNTPSQKRNIFIYVLLVHFLAFLFVWFRADAIPSTYMMLALSVCFWSLMALGQFKAGVWAFAFLTMTILIQPLEVYHYLSIRAQHLTQGYYEPYNSSFKKLEIKGPAVVLPKGGHLEKPDIYYASGNYNVLVQNINVYALYKYLRYKFILVDRLELMDPHKTDFPALEQHFLENDNKAFIFKGSFRGLKMQGTDPHPPVKAQRIAREDAHFKILSFDANRLKLAIEVPYEKFLIYNDCYDPYWRVSVNGHEAHLYQSNVAFKGVWVPAGKSIVEFHYGYLWQYALNFGLLAGAFVFLFGIIWYAIF